MSSDHYKIVFSKHYKSTRTILESPCQKVSYKQTNSEIKARISISTSWAESKYHQIITATFKDGPTLRASKYLEALKLDTQANTNLLIRRPCLNIVSCGPNAENVNATHGLIENLRYRGNSDNWPGLPRLNFKHSFCRVSQNQRLQCCTRVSGSTSA